MNRRKAIIACLLGMAGATLLKGETSGEIPPFLYIEIPENFPSWDSAKIVACPDGSSKYQICTETEKAGPPLKYALRVKYKDRVVSFTPDELMDILEGKEPGQYYITVEEK